MIIRRKIIVDYKYIYYFFILFPFIQQRTMEDFPNWLRMAFIYGSILSSGIIFCYVFSNKNNIKYVKRILWIVMIMIANIGITCLVKPANLHSSYNCVLLLALALFINMEINRNPKALIKVLTFIYTSYVLLNNILVILFPKGFHQSVVSYHSGHLLGDDNAIIFVALPAMIIMSINSLMNKGGITKFTWFNIFFCEFIFIKLWAVSAMIAFASFIILIFIGIYIIKIKPIKLLISLTIISTAIILGSNLSIIKKIIVDVLHKDITFSGRIYEWKYGLELMKEKPILGYGGYFKMGAKKYGNILYPVHTTYLQILVDGGLVLFCIFFKAIYTAFSKLSNNSKSNIAQVLSAGIFAIGISFIFEWAQLWHLIIILTIATNIDAIAQFECQKGEYNGIEGRI